MEEIINQLFAITIKSEKKGENPIKRQLDRIDHELKSMGYQVINPLGNVYKNEMTDIEANIAGDGDDLKITKVLKPIIYKEFDGEIRLVQKGIVIVG